MNDGTGETGIPVKESTRAIDQRNSYLMAGTGLTHRYHRLKPRAFGACVVLPASSHIARSGGVYRGRGPRAAALVAGYLRQQIVEANIRDGDDLPSEAVLMKQFDVSRPTLREALRVLESEGLLTVRRGSLGGFRVHAPDPKVAAQFAGRVLQHRGATLADIAQVRLMLEPQCAKLVAQHRTKSDLKRLKKCLEADQIDSSGAPSGNHRAFHQLIVELSGNQTLILMSSMLRHIIHDHPSSTDDNERTHDPRIRDIHKQHQHLMEAIDAKDAQRAEQLWTRHLRDGSNECT